MNPLHELRAAVEAAAADLRDGAAPGGARPTLERPKRAGHGDYSTNAAMLLAPALKAPPREIAERLGSALAERLGDRLDRVEVAGPGFLNVFLSDAWYGAALGAVLAAGDRWGAGTASAPERINLEYVSANPTGPLTAASGRHAAYGDSLARVLSFAGHHVSREYYFNDGGSQVEALGASVRAHARGEPVPEDGYQGEYVAELARRIPDAADAEPAATGRRAAQILMDAIRATLAAYRVEFDRWSLEGAVLEGDPSPLELAYERLREHGHLYESEGALWLRTTDYGDDKDRVLQRSTGAPTYFAADIAHHEATLRQGFDRLINVLGADHHGYIARMRAAIAALGEPPDRFEVPILQFVHIVEGGGRASMSKRRGEFVTLDELIGEIGVDATRFFMLQRSHESTIDLDLDLAREQSAENPVYYVQYAHARIASILREAVGRERAAGATHSLHASERELIKRLVAFPAEAAEAADRRVPHRIAAYALELAQAFTAFYRDCRVLGSEEEPFRLAVCDASRAVIARALDLLGIVAPEKM